MNQLEPTNSTALQQQDTNLPVDISWQDLQVAITGNLAKLSAEGQVKYYNALCKFTGLNPLGFPFAWITFQGKLVLYAKKECADQLCGLRKISIKIVERQFMEDIYIVRAYASTPPGPNFQETEATGAVPFKGLNADAKCIAIKKAETQAKRRAVLSLVGLGIMDQDEATDKPTVQTTIDAAQEESAHARTERLNAQLEKPIEVTTISESTQPVAQAATVETPLAAASSSAPEVPAAALPAGQPNPQPAHTPVSGAGLLSEDEVRNLEIALGEYPQPKRCVDYMEFKGAKKKGAGMETLRRNWFTLIIANPSKFFEKVDAWVKEGK